MKCSAAQIQWGPGALSQTPSGARLALTDNTGAIQPNTLTNLSARPHRAGLPAPIPLNLQDVKMMARAYISTADATTIRALGDSSAKTRADLLAELTFMRTSGTIRSIGLIPTGWETRLRAVLRPYLNLQRRRRGPASAGFSSFRTATRIRNMQKRWHKHLFACRRQ